MSPDHKHFKFTMLAVVLAVLCLANSALAQTTSFTYQGRLTDGGNAASGNYDLQFKLFDTPTVGTGTQQPQPSPVTETRSDQLVTAGIFTVTLDFSSNAFTGAPRYLEIGVRPAGSPNAFTVLSPRQPITSSPYAVQTLNAQRLGGIAASEYLTNANLGNSVIRNQTGLQANANFNIGGNGFIGGNVGIGTTNLGTSRVEIAAQDGLSITGFQPFLTLRDTNTGLRSLVSAGSGDLGFYPSSFIGSVPAVIIKNGSGNVGIGAGLTFGKLTVSGTGGATTPGAARFDLYNTTTSSGYLQHVTDSGLWQIATTPDGVTRMVLNQSGNVGIGTINPQARLQIAGTGANGFTLGVEGNVTQNRDKGGFVKGMVNVHANGTIVRCYNGQTGSTTPPCGMSANRITTGAYNVNFPFQVSDRFFSLTVEGLTGDTRSGMIGEISDPNALGIRIFESISGGNRDAFFYLIVY